MEPRTNPPAPKPVNKPLLPASPQAAKQAPDSEIQTLEAQLNGQYRIIRQLGKGAQGRVFLAIDTHSHQKVAIKQLLIQSVKDWKLYDLFHREANTLRRINIPGVARLHSTMELLNIETPMALIIQEYFEGDPLQTFIAKGHRFRIDQIGEILLQLTNILEKLHKCDPPVIHRDLKPSNIILNYDESSTTPRIHIIDFGAVSNPQVKGGGSTVVGTYGYMAPEQLMGHAEPKSDIYSLAIIAVYLLSGVAPENLEVEDFHVLIDAHLEHLPHEITVFLRSMLEPKSEDRIGDYDTIRAFFNAIRTQNLQAIPKIQGKFSATLKKYNLKDVRAYHQEGNIELWQELSDETPRMLPNQFVKRVNARAWSQFFNSDASTNIIVDVIVLVLGAVFSSVALLTSENLVNVLFTIPLALAGLFFGAFHIFSYLTKNPDHILAGELKDFVKNARKSMATVIRIDYIPFSYELEEGYWDISDRTASWNIIYSFNPPDDSSPDPLVRRFRTHAIPDALHEGDLIPILYRINRDITGETVQSMPYPMANSDRFTFSEVQNWR